VSQLASGDDIVVLFITSVKGKAEHFDVSLAPGRQNGLKVPSRIKCAKIATLDKKILLGELGSISDIEIKSVNEKVRKLFSL